MKKMIACLLLLFFATTSFCQRINDMAITREAYLQKSKNQKTTAWILLGSGAALIATGLLIGDREESSLDDAVTGGVIAIAGTVASIISIPVFIASSRNKRKATELAANLKWQRPPYSGNNWMTSRSLPTVSVTINF